MELKKKYNMLTAIAMVVGIIIGSGVFFKSGNILNATDGNLLLSILAWFIGGLVMIVSAYTFSLIAANTKKSPELADMAEETVGKKHSYVLSWYCAVIYYPLLVGILGWVCADFTCILFNITENVTPIVIVLAFVYVVLIYVLNMLAPKIAGYFQVSTTVIKLIPLGLMALIGIIFGLVSPEGVLVENFSSSTFLNNGSGFMAALCGTCFAYEGWIVATTIAKELKDSKKSLSKALIIGTIIVIVVYITYYIGLAGTYANSDFIANGNEQVKLAFEKIFGGIGGTLLYVFVVISCIGTLNGLTMGAMRNFKSIAESNNGPKPELFKKINKYNINLPSALVAFGLTLIWLSVWLVMLYEGLMKGASWAIDISELVIIFVYAAYIPMYISLIKNRKDLNKFNRFVMPILAICAALLMISAGIISHKTGCITFLLVSGTILFIGMLFYKENGSISYSNNSTDGLVLMEVDSYANTDTSGLVLMEVVEEPIDTSGLVLKELE